MAGELLLGVDGGNTKTHALVTDGAGTCARHGATPARPTSTTPSRSLRSSRSCGRASRRSRAAGASSSDLAASAFSLAGADWPEDFVLLRDELTRRLGLPSEPVIVNDGIGPLRCGTEDGVGVAAVMGTYCAVGARNAAGEIFHLGFWPDSTGAYALGSEALAAIWRNMLGLAPPTSMLARALELWDRSSAEDLLHVFTRIDDGLPAVAERARFAAAVLDEAELGDIVARDIVRHVGGLAGDYARVSAERTGQLGAPFPLVLLGGVLRHPSQLLRDAIHDRIPESVPVYPDIEPVVGALCSRPTRSARSPTGTRFATRSTGPRSPSDGRDPARGDDEGLSERGQGDRRDRPRHPRRRVHGARRAVGLRQVDAAADDRRARGGDRGARPHRRRGRRRSYARATATSRWCSRTTPSTRT